MGIASNPIDPRLSDLSAAFDEAAYRAEGLESDYRQFRVFALVAVAGLLIFISSDYRANGLGPVFLMLVAAKILFGAASAVLLLVLRRVRSPCAFDRAVLAWSLCYSVLMVIVDQTRAPDYTGHFLVNLLNLLGYYFLIPNTAPFRVGSAFFFTGLVLAGLGMDAAYIPGLEHFSIVASFALGNLVGIVGSARLERQRRGEWSARVELKAQLVRNERLVRETNHRVKNNLSAVDSLLNLQAADAADAGQGALREKLEESRARLQTIRLIHESLHRSDNPGAVELGPFLDRLARDILGLYIASGVRLETDLSLVVVDPETASSCGMVVTELITNALKHAFPGGRTGLLCLGLRIEGASCSISVRDDGVGLPGGFVPSAVSSMGMKIITGYVQQLRGRLAIGSGLRGGASFSFTFPHRGRTDSAS